MSRLPILVVLLFLCFPLFSQDKSIDEIRKNDYQIELGFRSIESIWRNTSGATVLFKKKHKKRNLENPETQNYWRAHVSLRSQANFSEDPRRRELDSTLIQHHPSSFVDFTFGLGLERQFQKRNFVHYYGMDLYGRGYASDEDGPYSRSIGGIILNSSNYLHRNERTLDIGVSPFFGIKYYITDQFNVGIESGFRLTYFNTRLQRIEVNRSGETTTFKKYQPVISNGTRFLFLGVRFVTLGYSF